LRLMSRYSIKKGDSFISVETITDQDDAVVDLTGATVTLTIKDRNGDDLHEEVVTSHTTPLSGITTVTISKTNTATFPVGFYNSSLVCDLADGTRHTIARFTEVADDYT